MRSGLLLLLAVVLTAGCGKREDENLGTSRMWGGADDEMFMGVAADGAGNLYAVGYTKSFGAGTDRDVLVVKFDSNMNEVWARTWGGNSDEAANAVAVVGSVVYVVGLTHSWGSGSSDALLMAWDTDGGLLWSRTWGGGQAEELHALYVNGTDLYAAGDTESFGAGQKDGLLLKYDASTNPPTLSWASVWGGTLNDRFYDLEVSGGAIWVSGTSRSFGAGDLDVLLAGFDTAAGALQNAYTWGGTSDDGANCLLLDGTSVILGGYSASFRVGSNDTQALMLSFDTVGAGVDWAALCGGDGSEAIADFVKTGGGYAYVGTVLTVVFLLHPVYGYCDSDGAQWKMWHWGTGGADLFNDCEMVSGQLVMAGGVTNRTDAWYAMNAAEMDVSLMSSFTSRAGTGTSPSGALGQAVTGTTTDVTGQAPGGAQLDAILTKIE